MTVPREHDGPLYGEVRSVERLAPRVVRVVLAGGTVASFRPTPFTDQYVNCLFAPEGAPYRVPFDVDEARQVPPGLRPAGRRYTVRWHDAVRAEVAIDFVVDDADCHLDLACPGELSVRWVHRNGPSADPDPLLAAVAAMDLPAGAPDVFVHGEAGEVRAVRRHLFGDRGLARDGASISPYWRRGHTEERWREIKRDWLAEVALDV